MLPENYFFAVFLLTILITRIFLYYKPVASPTIKGLRLHHYMYGLVLAVVGFVLSNITLYGVGLGLFVDELTYILIRRQSNYFFLGFQQFPFFDQKLWTSWTLTCQFGLFTPEKLKNNYFLWVTYIPFILFVTWMAGVS